MDIRWALYQIMGYAEPSKVLAEWFDVVAADPVFS